MFNFKISFPIKLNHGSLLCIQYNNYLSTQKGMDKYSLANTMFPLAQIFLLLWAILSSQTLVRGEWENMTETLQTDRLKPGMKTEKFYYFDQSGSLCVIVGFDNFAFNF
jgi:hypothetical protein